MLKKEMAWARKREKARERERERMVEFMDCEASLHKYTKTLLSLTSDWTLVRKNLLKWKEIFEMEWPLEMFI